MSFANTPLMPLLVFIILMLSLVFSLDLAPLLSPISQQWHQNCLEYFRSDALGRPIQSALFCGGRLWDTPWDVVISSLGLLPILVVSGLHLNLIDTLFKKILFRWPRLQLVVTSTALIFLCLLTQLQGPCLRATFYFASSRLNEQFQWQWPPAYGHLLAGSLCLSLFPSLWLTSSLIISWIVCLVITMFRHNKWSTVIAIYILLWPWQWSLFLNSPFTVIINAVLAMPILMFFLFLSVLDLFPFNLDIVWQWNFELLNELSGQTPRVTPLFNLPSLTQLWIYLWIIQILALLAPLRSKIWRNYLQRSQKWSSQL